MRCELISWRQFETLCQKLTHRLISTGCVPEMIVAIGRGGYTPARILADHLGIMDLASFRIEHYLGPTKSKQARIVYSLSASTRARRVLLMDDVSDSGDTFEVAIRHVREQGPPASLHTAVLHHKTVSSFTPDFYAHKVVKWRWITYPWAVTEDLASLIPRMQLDSTDTDYLREQLHRHYRMRVKRQHIENALRLLAQAEGAGTSA